MWIKNVERLEVINTNHVKCLSAWKKVGLEEYGIQFDMQDGDALEWRYPNENERDKDFERITELLEQGA